MSLKIHSENAMAQDTVKPTKAALSKKGGGKSTILNQVVLIGGVPTSHSPRTVLLEKGPHGYTARTVASPESTESKEGGSGLGRRGIIAYKSGGVDDFVTMVANAEPMDIVELERHGVKGSYLKALSQRMGISASRIFTIVGLPRATAERKASSGELVTGRSGQAAVAVTKLVGMAKEIVESSTSEEARGLDAAAWFGSWIEQPQPSLGGRRPAELLDTPTGADLVARVLGAIQSGAYQ